MSRSLIIFVTLIMMLACSTYTGATGSLPSKGYSMTIRSMPSGAYLTDPDTGRVIGITPVVISLDFKKIPISPGGCYDPPAIEAQWVSGVRAVYPTVSLCAGIVSYSLLLDQPSSSQQERDEDSRFAGHIDHIGTQNGKAAYAQASGMKPAPPLTVGHAPNAQFVSDCYHNDTFPIAKITCTPSHPVPAGTSWIK